MRAQPYRRIRAVVNVLLLFARQPVFAAVHGKSGDRKEAAAPALGQLRHQHRRDPCLRRAAANCPRPVGGFVTVRVHLGQGRHAERYEFLARISSQLHGSALDFGSNLVGAALGAWVTDRYVLQPMVRNDFAGHTSVGLALRMKFWRAQRSAAPNQLAPAAAGLCRGLALFSTDSQFRSWCQRGQTLHEHMQAEPIGAAMRRRGRPRYLPNTVLSSSVLRAAGLVRMRFSSCPTMMNTPSRVLRVT